MPWNGIIYCAHQEADEDGAVASLSVIFDLLFYSTALGKIPHLIIEST